MSKIREILEELLVGHLTEDEDREVWRISENQPFTNLDFVQKKFSEEINQAEAQIKKAVIEMLPKERSHVYRDPNNPDYGNMNAVGKAKAR